MNFVAVDGFDWATAMVDPDLRNDYGEVRLRVTGLIGDRQHVLEYATRGTDGRIISFRKANTRQAERWHT